ncbi:MAG: DUF3040 domain-containing protein, partial [Streptosporangiaceae bacterium]
MSAREQRILTEIERHLAADEPRLQQALTSAKLPSLRRRLVAGPRCAGAGKRGWLIAACVPLLCGMVVLAIGLVLGIGLLALAGALVGQFGPVAVGYLHSRTRRTRVI